jgi:DNA-binding CsgD family transcriptional regulator
MKALVQIVGSLTLQNSLLVSFLENEVGLNCQYSQHLDLPSISRSELNTVIMWDCISNEIGELWPSFGEKWDFKSENCFIALFNADLDAKMFPKYKEAVNRGIRGIFFENDSPEIIAKGVEAILRGELWFSRDFLAKCVLEKTHNEGYTPKAHPNVTRREKEILLLVASGFSNDEIAERLNISPHTVKTHLYNIYQKLKVPNRLQAALWATKNL